MKERYLYVVFCKTADDPFDYELLPKNWWEEDDNPVMDELFGVGEDGKFILAPPSPVTEYFMGYHDGAPIVA